MRFVLTALAMIGGIVFTLIGLGFFFQPDSTGANFALLPDGVPGLAVMRADMTAFFVVGGGCLIWGAWKRNGELLLVPAASSTASALWGAINPAATQATAAAAGLRCLP